MSNETNLTVADRINQLMQHLKIAKAHFAGRLPKDWASSAIAHPEQILSLILVFPPAIPPVAMAKVASKTLVFNGDKGPFANTVKQIVADASGTTLVTMHEYAGNVWDDVITDHVDEIGSEILSFLSAKGTEATTPVIPQNQVEGEVSGISYSMHGSGPPLLLFPLALSPSQWEPLISRLGQHYCTITLGGAEIGIIAGLEERATNSGFVNMFRKLIMEAKLQPEESILEVGPGTGIHSRWLANQTRRENPITGVDINNYLVGEATKLAKKAGLKDVINFRKGNGESLPFADNTFDFAFSVTVLEEGDADKMIAEMVRVIKPGGRVGAIVRALDIPFVINLPLRPDLKKKVEGFPNGAVVDKGCADGSLYRRFRQAGMSEIKRFPQFAAYDETSPMNLQHFLSLTFNRLDQDEQAEWNTVISAEEAKDDFFISAPHHCVIGTKV